MNTKLELAIWSQETGQWIYCVDRCQLIITWLFNIIKDARNEDCMSLLNHQLQFGSYLVLLIHHCHCVYVPMSNTTSHDNHLKINSWVSFAFLNGYGTPSLPPLGKPELLYNFDKFNVLIFLVVILFCWQIGEVQIFDCVNLVSNESNVLMKVSHSFPFTE